MSNTRFRRGGKYAADMAVYSRQISMDNQGEVTALRRNLVRAMQEEITPRQRQLLELYYNEKHTMREIAIELGVNKSTVSRTIRRAEARLGRCIRYGAQHLLRAEETF